MSIQSISTEQLRRMGDQEGLVLQGCGGDPQEWLDGINEILTEEDILKKGARFEEAYTFQHDGLTCLLFPFKQDMELDMGKLAVYEVFLREQTVGNASEFISMAIEENLDTVANTKTYADYIATRPRAERFGSHGLFTDEGVEVQLSKVSQELNAYKGNVYTAILSLKREDAARLGFDSGGRWRDFLRGQTQTLAENLKIPIPNLMKRLEAIWEISYHLRKNNGSRPDGQTWRRSCGNAGRK